MVMKRQMISHYVKPSAVRIGGSINKWHKDIEIVQALKDRQAET
jgi:hypothetical protein